MAKDTLKTGQKCQNLQQKHPEAINTAGTEPAAKSAKYAAEIMEIAVNIGNNNMLSPAFQGWNFDNLCFWHFLYV